jgi:hypothetical protein
LWQTLKKSPGRFQSFRGIFRLRLLGFQFGNEDFFVLVRTVSIRKLLAFSSKVTLTAIGFFKFITDIHRMNKAAYLGTGGDILLLLAQRLVTEVAVLGNNPAVG